MVEDTPQDLVHDLLAEAVFGNHALGRPVIGRAGVISSVSKRSLAAYHRQMYRAGNIVVSAAGNLEHDHLLPLLERAAHQRVEPPQAGASVRKPLVKPPPSGLRFQRKDTEQYHVCVGATGISRSDRRRFAASVLDAILGGSASSRLFQEIREKRGMAYAVYTFAGQYSDTGQIGVYIGTREENLEPCLAIVTEQIADVAAGNVSRAELERAKENLKGRMVLSMESTSSRMSRLGRALITDTELLSLDRVIAEVDAVDQSGIAELAAVLLAPEQLSAAGRARSASSPLWSVSTQGCPSRPPPESSGHGHPHTVVRDRQTGGAPPDGDRRDDSPRDWVDPGYGPVTRVRDPHRAVT